MSENTNLMPPPDGESEDLGALLTQRSKQPRSKLTTTLIVVIVLLVGVFIGVPIGKATSSGSAGGPPAGFPITNTGTGTPMMPNPGASGQDQGTPGQGAPGQGAPGQGAPGGFGGRGTSGTITKVDGSTITVKTQDGSEVTVTTTDQTQVTESAQVPVDQLEEGTNVMVIGQSADDGSVAADRIIAGDSAFAGPPGAGAMR